VKKMGGRLARSSITRAWGPPPDGGGIRAHFRENERVGSPILARKKRPSELAQSSLEETRSALTARKRACIRGGEKKKDPLKNTSPDIQRTWEFVMHVKNGRGGGMAGDNP